MWTFLSFETSVRIYLNSFLKLPQCIQTDRKFQKETLTSVNWWFIHAQDLQLGCPAYSLADTTFCGSHTGMFVVVTSEIVMVAAWCWPEETDSETAIIRPTLLCWGCGCWNIYKKIKFEDTGHISIGSRDAEGEMRGCNILSCSIFHNPTLANVDTYQIPRKLPGLYSTCLQDILCNLGTYTNGYSICVHSNIGQTKATYMFRCNLGFTVFEERHTIAYHSY